MIQRFMTNLNCGSCVDAVTPLLNSDPAIERWSVDTNDPRKVLTVAGDAVAPSAVERLVAQAGFRILGPVSDPATAVDARPPTGSVWTTYRPLLLIVAYIVGVITLIELIAPPPNAMRAMQHFMGGFFIVFSFFKLLDLRAFSDAFRSYDVIARAHPAYAWAYPFVELALGVAYLAGLFPTWTNGITLAVMLLGLIGVTQTLKAGRQIQCACLGTVFKLPMTKVTFVENALMAAMAVMMLADLMFV